MDLTREVRWLSVLSQCTCGALHPRPPIRVEHLVLATDTRGVQVLAPFPPIPLLRVLPSIN